MCIYPDFFFRIIRHQKLEMIHTYPYIWIQKILGKDGEPSNTMLSRSEIIYFQVWSSL